MISTRTPPPRVVSARFVAGAKDVRHLPAPIGIEIAFAGKSNVGKSSLLNSLMERKHLARTSSTPGCTRQISFFEVTASDGSIVTLVDLPGYGYARRSKQERSEWDRLITGYLTERVTLAAVVVLVDARRGIAEEDRELLQMLDTGPRAQRRPLEKILVATKIDKLAASKRRQELHRLGAGLGQKILPFSTGEPNSSLELWSRLRSQLVFASPELSDPQEQLRVPRPPRQPP